MLLSNDVTDRMRHCSDLYKTCRQRFSVHKLDVSCEDELCLGADDDDLDVKPTDSISQVACRYTVTFSASALLQKRDKERVQEMERDCLTHRLCPL